MAPPAEDLGAFKQMIVRLFEAAPSEPNRMVAYTEAMLSLVHRYASGGIGWAEFVEEGQHLID